jgi:hypothetical protein
VVGAQNTSAWPGLRLVLSEGFNEDYDTFGWKTSCLPNPRDKVHASLLTAQPFGLVHNFQIQMQKTVMTF